MDTELGNESKKMNSYEQGCSAKLLTRGANNRILETTPRRDLQNSALSPPS